MSTPLVEMDGDEMTRVLWAWIKEILITPYVDLKTEYYDLGLKNRDITEDTVTVEAAEATRRLGVAVKCATITPNNDRMTEYKLHKKWRSPNATLRKIIGGTILRTPITLPCMTPLIPQWTKPITVARHAYGDCYSGTEYRITNPGKIILMYDPQDSAAKKEHFEVHTFNNNGIVQSIYNEESSIYNFAKVCFEYALDTKQDLWFGTKDTISQIYDACFKEIFTTLYEKEYADKFKANNIVFNYSLIDDIVARVIRSNGGFIWACKNYDGDVMSDMVATVYGSLAMMTSVLVSPDGKYEYEAAHGTVTRHYYKYLSGEPTSTNPMATLFAWTGALSKRAQLDNLPELLEFSTKLESAAKKTIESGYTTKDLAGKLKLDEVAVLNSKDFLSKIASNL